MQCYSRRATGGVAQRRRTAVRVAESLLSLIQYLTVCSIETPWKQSVSSASQSTHSHSVYGRSVGGWVAEHYRLL